MAQHELTIQLHTVFFPFRRKNNCKEVKAKGRILTRLGLLLFLVLTSQPASVNPNAKEGLLFPGFSKSWHCQGRLSFDSTPTIADIYRLRE